MKNLRRELNIQITDEILDHIWKESCNEISYPVRADVMNEVRGIVEIEVLEVWALVWREVVNETNI